MTQPRLGELLLVFCKLGRTSFGGGLSGWIHREVVARRGWMTEDQFMAGVAVTQVLPGPNAVNLALYIGQRLRGWTGFCVSGAGILLPPFIVIVLLAWGFDAVSGMPGLEFVLSGMTAAGIGMTVVMGLRSARRMRGWVPWGIAAGIFGAVGVLQWPMLAVAAPASVWACWHG